MPNLNKLEKAMPVAPLKLLVLDSCKDIGDQVNSYLVDFRKIPPFKVSFYSLWHTTYSHVYSQIPHQFTIR